jgi:hypothetical protein
MKSTNFWDVVVTLLYLSYILIAFGGAAFLVTSCGWSAWWMLFPACCMAVRIKTGNGE